MQVETLKLNLSERRQVLFLEQFNGNSVILSAADYYDLIRGMLISVSFLCHHFMSDEFEFTIQGGCFNLIWQVLGAILTYLVVLVQLKLQLGVRN